MKRILLVEPVSDFLATFLDGRFELDIATTAEAGAALLEVRSYVAVVSELELAIHDGVWLLERAARRQPAARRVLLSDRSEDFVDTRRSGVEFAFLGKPLPFGRLLDLIDPPAA